MSFDMEQAMKQQLDGNFMKFDDQTGCFYWKRVHRDFVPIMWEKYAASVRMTGTRNGKHKPWPVSNDNLLIDLRAQGLTWETIGKRLRRSETFCRFRYLDVCQERNMEPLLDVRRLKVAA